MKAKVRQGAGKGVARRLRREGWIPAVLYGEGVENRLLLIEARRLDALFRTAGVGSHLVDLEVEGDSGAKLLALLKEIQQDPVRGGVLHVDLQHVSLEKKIHLSVPVVLEGEPVGVKTGGGVLELLAREIELQCLPDNIPDEIRVDVSALEIGQSIHISEVVVEGATILTAGDTGVATVVRPTKVEEVKPPVEEEAEAEEEKPEEREEGAPSAEEKPSESGG